MSEELHDLIIIMKNGTTTHRIPAHKLILAFASPFFKTQLYSKHWTLDSHTYVSPRIITNEPNNNISKKRLY